MKRPSPPGEGPWWIAVLVAACRDLPPPSSRLPPEAGKKGEKPEPKELELRYDGYLGEGQLDRHATAVGADGDGGKLA